ncbi:phasin family protein [Lysobacter sp. D1-1-M9]|uniref:phasin family protein n=1 Tax=Novilysobacter longmucuonensis TaxID=3098603 RepID=UPI002FC7E3DB
MYQQFNEQFTAATRQFADTAAQINRLALDNASAVFGLQVAALEERVNANFAFWGEAAEARDIDSLKTLLPKGAQLARENIERTVSTSQEVLGRSIKANEAIAQIAKAQAETAAKATRENVEQATKAATDKAEATYADVAKTAKNSTK